MCTHTAFISQHRWLDALLYCLVSPLSVRTRAISGPNTMRSLPNVPDTSQDRLSPAMNPSMRTAPLPEALRSVPTDVIEVRSQERVLG